MVSWWSKRHFLFLVLLLQKGIEMKKCVFGVSYEKFFLPPLSFVTYFISLQLRTHPYLPCPVAWVSTMSVVKDLESYFGVKTRKSLWIAILFFPFTVDSELNLSVCSRRNKCTLLKSSLKRVIYFSNMHHSIAIAFWNSFILIFFIHLEGWFSSGHHLSFPLSVLWDRFSLWQSDLIIWIAYQASYIAIRLAFQSRLKMAQPRLACNGDFRANEARASDLPLQFPVRLWNFKLVSALESQSS